MRAVCALLVHLMLMTFVAVDCEKILLIPMQFHSRRAELIVIGQELAKKGHDVFCIVPQGKREELQASNRDITMVGYKHPEDMMLLPSDEYDEWIGEMVFSGSSIDEVMYNEVKREYADCVCMIEDADMLAKLNGMEFDFALADGMYMPPCYFAIAVKLNLRFVSVFAAVGGSWMGLPILPPFQPSYFKHSTDRMTFLQKLNNVVEYIITSSPLVLDAMIGIDKNEILRHIPHIDSWIDLYSKAEFYIVGLDHHLEWPVVTMPHILHIPALTIQPPKPLTQQFQQIANSSQNGFILMSFGSNSAHLPADVFDKFVSAFERLQLTVIWKVSLDEHRAAKLPRNIVTRKWLPQNDLLGNENCKLFITHCGNNGQYESVYNGVPMIGFPMYIDQGRNAFRIDAKGLGKQLNILDFTSDDLFNAIQEILVLNATFKHRVQHLSNVLRSRPMLPREEAAHWTEQIMRYGNGHLRPSTMDMAIYEMLALDVFVFVEVVLLLAVMFITLLLFCVYKRCKRGLSSKQKRE